MVLYVSLVYLVVFCLHRRAEFFYRVIASASKRGLINVNFSYCASAIAIAIAAKFVRAIVTTNKSE